MGVGKARVRVQCLQTGSVYTGTSSYSTAQGVAKVPHKLERDRPPGRRTAWMARSRLKRSWQRVVQFAPSGVCCALPSRCNARSVRLEALVEPEHTNWRREPRTTLRAIDFLLFEHHYRHRRPRRVPMRWKMLQSLIQRNGYETCAPR